MPGITTNPRLQASYFRVKYRGVFHIKSYYGNMHEWLKYNEWKGIWEGKDNRHEHYFLERTNLGGDKEFWAWWRVHKPSLGNPYYIYQMFVTFHGVGITGSEVMHKGKKYKVEKGEVEVKIRTWVELDQDEAWSKHKFLTLVHKIFPQRIFLNELEDHKKEAYRQSFQFQGFMKNYLKMRGFLPEKELKEFHPSRAFPG